MHRAPGEPVIETDRLVLRNWCEADIAPFITHTNTPAVMRWLGGVASPEASAARIRERTMRWQAERGFTFWVVQRKADAALLGFCGLKLADGAGSPVAGIHEIGWRLREDAWGQGYAREAAFAALDHGFTILRAPRIVALTVAGNRASWGLMERLGMTRRADLDHQDPDPTWSAYNPIIVYERMRETWTGRPS